MDTVTHTRQRDTTGMAGGHMRTPTHPCAHTHHSSSVSESLSGLHDLAELWLTLFGLLHRVSSHLAAFWLVDQAAGS